MVLSTANRKWPHRDYLWIHDNYNLKQFISCLLASVAGNCRLYFCCQTGSRQQWRVLSGEGAGEYLLATASCSPSAYITASSYSPLETNSRAYEAHMFGPSVTAEERPCGQHIQWKFPFAAGQWSYWWPISQTCLSSSWKINLNAFDLLKKNKKSSTQTPFSGHHTITSEKNKMFNK